MSLIDTFFNPDVIMSSLPALLRGFLNTLLLGVMSIVIGVAAGLAISLVRLYAPKPLRWLAIGYTDIFRALPVLVVLMPEESAAALSFRNLARVAVLTPENVGVTDVLGAAQLVISQQALDALTARTAKPRGGEEAER